MTAIGIFQLLLFFGLVVLITKPLGAYMYRVFAGERTLLSPVMQPIERVFYKLFGVKEDDDQSWVQYACALLAYSIVGALVTYALLRL